MGRLTDMLALATVPRWSIVPTLRPQYMAEHIYRVQVILHELIERIGLGPGSVLDSGNAMLWALFHDAPESHSGDIQSNFKKFIESYDTRVIDGERMFIANPLQLAEARAVPWFADYRDSVAPIARDLVKIADRIEMLTWLSDWGHGKHAEFVVSEMRAKLYQAAQQFEETHKIAILPVVGVIIDEILRQDGRRTIPK